MPSLRYFRSWVAAVAAVLLVHAAPAIGGHAGWYFDSFSWSALLTYFGQGTPGQKAAFLKQLDRVVAENKKEQYPALNVSERRISLWRSFIKDGLDYSKLTPDDLYLADRVLNASMSPEAGLAQLKVRPETSPDFIHPRSFQMALAHSTGAGRKLLRAFEYGRSYGQTQPRLKCPRDAPETKAWICFGTNVVLSPMECGLLATELKRLLGLPALASEREYLQGFQIALARASTQGRGMYVRTSD
jgi:hypothetical protein